jgi:acetyl-CoA synthetase
VDAPLHEIACDRQDAAAPALAHHWADGSVDRLSFGDLALASRALASRLSEAGVRAGARVAIALPQAPLHPVAHLACSRVGAITVPLSPMLGADALTPRLARAAPTLALVDASRAEAFRAADPALPLWIAQGRNLRTTRGTLPAREAAPLSPRPLSLFFTSGTTAEPKCVALPRGVVAGRMPGFRRAHPEASRFWSPAEWSWIGGLHDALFAPWIAGLCVVSAQREGRFDPAAAARLIEAERVDAAFLPPTALKRWRASGLPAPRLASLHAAGEPLQPAARAWAEAGAAVREVYGLTECAFVLLDGEPVNSARVELDRGEVRVAAGAPTMMLGYVEDGEARLPLDADGFFRTGDEAREEGGRLRVVGRLDDIIKSSGYRISPGEVEAALLRHPAVAECAVVGVPDEARGHAVKAFVKLADGARADAEALRAHVRDHAGAYMTPREVVFVDALPQTVNGKLLRRHLR